MNHKRKRPRTAPITNYAPVFAPGRRKGRCTTPQWYNITFHTRPQRRAADRMVRAVLHGADPDGMAWPLARKPHWYCW